MTWEFEREIVIGIGGSSGIGAAIVELLVQNGIKPFILDVTEPREELRSETFFCKVDLANPEAIKLMAAKLLSEHRDPTVLINDAGIEFSESSIRILFDVNILAHFLLVREFLPAMISRNHGHVVSIAILALFITSALILIMHVRNLLHWIFMRG